MLPWAGSLLESAIPFTLWLSNPFSHHKWESKSQKRGGNDPYEVSYLSFNAVSLANCVSLQYFSLPPPMFSCYFFFLQLIALSFRPFPLLLMPVFFKPGLSISLRAFPSKEGLDISVLHSKPNKVNNPPCLRRGSPVFSLRGRLFISSQALRPLGEGHRWQWNAQGAAPDLHRGVPQSMWAHHGVPGDKFR